MTHAAVESAPLDAQLNQHRWTRSNWPTSTPGGEPRTICPWARSSYRRNNHQNFHVRGYNEEGTTTTPFDMCVMNQIDRFNLAIDVIDRVERLRPVAAHAREQLRNKLIEHRQYIRQHGQDMPEITGWSWFTATER